MKKRSRDMQKAAAGAAARPKSSANSRAASSPDGQRRAVRMAAVLVVLAVGAVYANSLQGPFILDDLDSIPRNPTIRSLWPPGPVLHPPADDGETVGGRPLLNLTLAFNYAIGGTDVQVYHLTNALIHVLAALVLMGIVRRTLLLPSMPAQLNHAALVLAAAAAMLWAVHPLQTEAVTYIIQRAESLMGLLYLLTLYCAIRASASPSIFWPIAAVVSCALGMATKEVMVTAPAIVLLYDRTFLAQSFGLALRSRWRLYVGLAACWGVLAYLMFASGSRGDTVGLGAVRSVNWWTYAQTECWAVLKYLQLAFWPDGLCLHYGRNLVKTASEILPGAILAALLAATTLWGLWRGRKWAFLGAWFLVVLAPTSSVVPLLDPIFEHRMYLALAAVTVAVVVGVFLIWERTTSRGQLIAQPRAARRYTTPMLALAAAVVALGATAANRNSDYRSALSIWQDTVAKSPDNPLAHELLGAALCESGRIQDAIKELRRAVELDPYNPYVKTNLAKVMDLARPPRSSRHNAKGYALYKAGRSQDAILEFEQAIADDPKDAEAHYNFGTALGHLGRGDQAIAQFRLAIQCNPEHARAHNNLGVMLSEKGNSQEAIDHFRLAIQSNPGFALPYKCLAQELKKLGRDNEAGDVIRQMPR